MLKRAKRSKVMALTNNICFLSAFFFLAGKVLISQSYKYSWKLWGISQSDSLMWDFKNGCFLWPPYLSTKCLMNVYFRRSWTSPEVFPLLEWDCNNYVICRALPTWGEISAGTLDKQAPSPAVLHTHTNPTTCLPDGLKPCLCKGRKPCHTIPNSWVLLSHSCPGRGSTRHSFRRTHWCELSLDPL